VAAALLAITGSHRSPGSAGSGASPAPATAGGARAYAEQIAAVLVGLDSAPYVVVGHSSVDVLPASSLRSTPNSWTNWS